MILGAREKKSELDVVITLKDFKASFTQWGFHMKEVFIVYELFT